MSAGIFEEQDPIFSRTKANKLILKIKNGSNDRIKDKAKIELFRHMKKVVEKNVNNYLKLFRNSPAFEKSFEREEVYSEAFLLMNKCLEKFKIKKGNCFYFYFNKTLSRAFYRMLEKSTRRTNIMNNYGENIFITETNQTTKASYSIELIMETMNFSEEEIKVINSRMSGQTRKDFLEQNEDMTSNHYAKIVNNLKVKMQKVKDNEL